MPLSNGETQMGEQLLVGAGAGAGMMVILNHPMSPNWVQVFVLLVYGLTYDLFSWPATAGLWIRLLSLWLMSAVRRRVTAWVAVTATFWNSHSHGNQIRRKLWIVATDFANRRILRDRRIPPIDNFFFRNRMWSFKSIFWIFSGMWYFKSALWTFKSTFWTFNQIR